MTIPPLYNPEDIPFIYQAISYYLALELAWSMMWYLRGKNNWLAKLLIKKKQNDSQS